MKIKEKFVLECGVYFVRRNVVDVDSLNVPPLYFDVVSLTKIIKRLWPRRGSSSSVLVV